jgi:hypothetical protein
MNDVKLLLGLFITTLLTLVLLIPMLPYVWVLWLSEMLRCYKVTIWLYNLADRYGEKIVRPVVRKTQKILPEGMVITL